MGAWINWNYIQLSPPPWLGQSTCHILVESSVILDCHILLESGQNGTDSVDNNQETKVRHRGAMIFLAFLCELLKDFRHALGSNVHEVCQ